MKRLRAVRCRWSRMHEEKMCRVRWQYHPNHSKSNRNEHGKKEIRSEGSKEATRACRERTNAYRKMKCVPDIHLTLRGQAGQRALWSPTPNAGNLDKLPILLCNFEHLQKVRRKREASDKFPLSPRLTSPCHLPTITIFSPPSES
ncbi:hypothetical protein TREMEDRAFT_58110 [Tremella mesenterica DSM 1558]|uniref:uncharacterized protein n=1 Tax=Tremella mesenterica (strain ATCC 24925 / CBS 8224 / DSM 1558 / NBRC 9311 / NRRL Y-6157 / RJB 2259-6 / UBC 559-6) TaxID=578456 RepID=UPI0003F4975A|nr:uncharacterized protein TREMEDRAFT_58110 [Tremella mesenterica DSM 1558]EIW71967.1 hypothetical protein TREMEDRAFT_58110 [Tremella mesenterica DSM 1558]